jgi:hypothetical protein
MLGLANESWLSDGMPHPFRHYAGFWPKADYRHAPEFAGYRYFAALMNWLKASHHTTAVV